jgi:competence protein ComEC
VVEWLGAWRFAAVYTANPRIAAWLISVYIIIAFCWYFRGKRGFRILPTMIGTVSLLLCAALLTAYADSRRALRFTALDVEQGQCLVLQSDGGVMLIDCGGPSSADAGTRAADDVESRFLKGVDVLLLTHLHSDHANGAEKLLWRVPVRLLLLPADAEDDDALLPGILAAAAARGTEVRFLSADQALSLGALHAELYVPQGGAGDNERGLIVSGHCGEYDFLVTGDAGIQTENQLLRRAELPREELLVVGHHGSRNSTGDALLRRTRPVNAVISVGGNSYGHPTQEVLDRLAACGTAVWRTDRSGNITFSLLK